MRGNHMQFQKGMSLANFMKHYGTEDQCKDALYRLRWPNGFYCPECLCSRYSEVKSRNVYQCNDCRYQTTLYAGTVYEQTKLPLRKWFLAGYLLCQDMENCSAAYLSRHLRVSYNSARSLRHKLMPAISG